MGGTILYYYAVHDSAGKCGWMVALPLPWCKAQLSVHQSIGT